MADKKAPLMYCPGCRNTMERLQIRSIELDQCRDCRGVWLDHQEVDELFAMPKIPERFLNMERYREAPVMVEQGKRVCPRCSDTLKLIEVDGIKLDACSECKGFYADIGELKALADAAEVRYAQQVREAKAEGTSDGV